MDNTFTNIDEILREGGRRMREAMVNQLIENGSLGTGKLARSIQEKVVQQGGKSTLLILMENYGWYVEKGIGRGPGKRPPVKPLIDWLTQKQIRIPSGLDKKSYAFAIANKIAKEGTDPKPRPFIQPSVTLVKSQYLDKALMQSGTQDIDKFINKAFSLNGGKLR